MDELLRTAQERFREENLRLLNHYHFDYQELFHPSNSTNDKGKFFEVIVCMMHNAICWPDLPLKLRTTMGVDFWGDCGVDGVGDGIVIQAKYRNGNGHVSWSHTAKFLFFAMHTTLKDHRRLLITTPGIPVSSRFGELFDIIRYGEETIQRWLDEQALIYRANNQLEIIQTSIPIDMPSVTEATPNEISTEIEEESTEIEEESTEIKEESTEIEEESTEIEEESTEIEEESTEIEEESLVLTDSIAAVLTDSIAAVPTDSIAAVLTDSIAAVPTDSITAVPTVIPVSTGPCLLVYHRTGIRQDWIDRYHLLVDYVNVNGNIPPRSVPELGWWVDRNRQKYKQNRLVTRQIELLESVSGWVWDVFRSAWQNKYELLLEYIRDRNKIPPQSESSLGSWCHENRENYKDGKLTTEKIGLLEQIPLWSWRIRDDRWHAKYDELLAYVAEYDILPKKGRSVLGTWCATNRRRYRTGLMPQNRIELLDRIPLWVWKPHIPSWQENFDAVLAHVAEHNYLPKQSIPILGDWIQRMRREYKGRKLRADYIHKLEEIPIWYWRTSKDPIEAFPLFRRFVETNHCMPYCRGGAHIAVVVNHINIRSAIRKMYKNCSLDDQDQDEFDSLVAQYSVGQDWKPVGW